MKVGKLEIFGMKLEVCRKHKGITACRYCPLKKCEIDDIREEYLRILLRIRKSE